MIYRFTFQFKRLPIRQNSCRLDRTTTGAAMKDKNGSIRTSIQGQGVSPVAGTRERSTARGCARLGRWGANPRALARTGADRHQEAIRRWGITSTM